MRILIIGGTQFIGLALVNRLVAMGHEISVFHRNPVPDSFPGNIHHILGDRLHLKKFKQEFRQFAPHIVVDMIAMVEKDAKDLMDVFRGLAERVIVISSQDVYKAYAVLIGLESGPIVPVPIPESGMLREKLYPYRGEQLRQPEDPLKRWDFYEKLLVEKTVMNDPDLPVTILRLPMVYGPNDGQYRFYDLIYRMDKGRSIIMEDKYAQWCSTYGYVENIAAAITATIDNSRSINQIYNVGEPDFLSMKEWGELIGNVMGWTGKIVVLSSDQLPASLRPKINTKQNTTVDSVKIREEIGYQEHVSREDALRLTIDWERRNPPHRKLVTESDLKIEDDVLAIYNK